MSSLQVRLFLTYLVIIIVTLGLAALSLFLQIGGYRDSISYGNLEDLGRLIDSQAAAELQRSGDTGPVIPGQSTVPPASDLLLALKTFVSNAPGRVSNNTSVAVI